MSAPPRTPSILDFEELCDRRGIRIERTVYVDSTSGQEIADDPNSDADIAGVTLSQREAPRR